MKRKERLRLTLLRALALAIRPPAVRAATSGGERSILVIRPDHLGDVLLCTPALRLLRTMDPAAHITALVGPWSARVLVGSTSVDRVVACPFPGFARSGERGLLQPYAMLWRWARWLRRERFDLAVNLRPDFWWGAMLAHVARVPRRVGYATAETRPFLNVALDWPRDTHSTLLNLALVRAALGRRETSGQDEERFSVEAHLEFALAVEDREWLEVFLAAEGLVGQRYVVLHAGSGGVAKLWPPASLAAAGDAVARAQGVRLVLTGSSDEAALVGQVARAAGVRTINAAGRTNAGQLAALLSRAALVIGPDSGPLHLATALATPTIHLYGPSDHLVFGPWGDGALHRAVRSGIFCSPCHELQFCPRRLPGPPCMEGIAVETVSSLACALLDRAQQGVREA